MLAVDLAGEGVNIELWLKTESFRRNPRSRNRMPKRKARSKSMHAEAKALAGRGVAGWGGKGQEGGGVQACRASRAGGCRYGGVGRRHC